jgi:hypothetical protein
MDVLDGHGRSWTLTMEAWWLEREPRKGCMPVVADFKHFDEEQEPNPDPK